MVTEDTCSSKCGNRKPPKLASNILMLCLPAHLKQPVLGDLEEEFKGLEKSKRGKISADYWYWKQAIKSALIYIWQGRGSTMAYLLGFLFFVAIMFLEMLISGHLSTFYNVPSMVVVLPPAIALGIAATSVSSLKLAFRLAFSDEDNIEKTDARRAVRFLRVMGNQSIFLGCIGFLTGAISISDHMGREGFQDNTGVAVAIMFLPLFYAMIIKCVLYSADQKIFGKYLED